MEQSSARNRLAFALDYASLTAAKDGAANVAHSVGVLKVGLELFIKEGPAAVALGAELNCRIFLDLKLHDIPETVDRAVASACSLGVSYLTVHATGGPRMLEMAAARVQKEGGGLTLLGVTVLTSLDAHDLAEVGVSDGPADQALRLARLAVSHGIGGLVCSAAEVGVIRRAVGPSPVLVTPGIRPLSGGNDDQKRVGTPEDAIRAGSSILVVGRPIRDAADPMAAARSIANSIASATMNE